ncbi:MAG: hypothetical protein WEB00_12335 [Dehalococcoidia bacterium]
MARKASFRYLGDQQALTVHDLDNEDEENCGTRPLLRAGHGITFRPDHLREASRRGFQPCEFCLKEIDVEAEAQPPDPLRLRQSVYRDRAHPATP